jgi:glycosyltransferase involved in cell wall biosynthesis
MKIVVFYQYFGTPKGGWSTRIYEMCQRWIQQGAEVTVITSPYDKSDIKATKFFDQQNIDGIKVKIVNVPQSNKHSIPRRIYTFFVFSVLSVVYALKEDYDVILCSSGPITVGLSGIIAKFFRRSKKFVFEVRDLWPQGAVELGVLKNPIAKKLAYQFEKTCYQSADLVVTCSLGQTQNIQNRYPSLKIITVPNASDNKLFQQKGSNANQFLEFENKKIFIYAGSLGVIDDCMQIIDGILLQPFREDVVYVFAGDGVDGKIMREKVTQSQRNDIYFLGLIPKIELVKLLKMSYAAFFTTSNIPMIQTCSPNKLFDYFAAGLPVIQNTTGWIKELIQAKKAGINVEQNSPQSMSDAIEFMINHVEERKQFIRQGFQLAENDFDRDKLSVYYFSEMKKLML